MAKLECALLDILIKPMASTPLLSIVVPTFQRPDEMIQTVSALANQIKGDGLGDKVEILISDIGLLDGSGLELMGLAKARHNRLRGIALSGFGMEEDIHRSSQAGFDFHLTKPVDLQALENLLAHLSEA